MLVNGRGALSGGTQAFAGGIGDHSQQRTYRFESMQAELVQAVEVYKSVQANLHGGRDGRHASTSAPGGRSTTADAGFVAGNAFVTDDDLAEENGYRFAGVYSDSFADNTLGFLVSVAGDDRTTREDWFNVTDSEAKVFNNAINLATGELLRGCDLPGIANPDVGCGYAFGNVRQGILIEDVQRINASAALQWRPNEQWGRHRRHPVLTDGPRLRRLADSVAPPGGARKRRERGVAQREPDRDVHPHGEGAATTVPIVPRVRRHRTTHQFAVNAKYTPTENWTLNFDVSHSSGGPGSGPGTKATTTSRPCR